MDDRDYMDSAEMLKQIGVRSVQLITNNPRKVSGLRDAGLEIESVRSLAVAANGQTVGYLRTKRDRLGHDSPLGAPLQEVLSAAPDVSSLIGTIPPDGKRPLVVLKYAAVDGWANRNCERRLTLDQQFEGARRFTRASGTLRCHNGRPRDGRQRRSAAVGATRTGPVADAQ